MWHRRETRRQTEKPNPDPKLKRIQTTCPELPIGRLLKSKSLGGNRVILDVTRLNGNLRLKQISSSYANTDFDLRSPKPFDVLNTELSDACCILHYAEAQDGTWTASYEADRLNDSATNDILAFIDVLSRLSDVAKQELAECTVRDFNIGVNCWDTWAYNIGIPPSTVASVANAGCSISFTLYPMRGPDGTPKIDPHDG